MVISVVSSICPPFPFLMSYVSAVSHTRCSMPPCMFGGQRSVLKYISSFLKCFLIYSSYINIMQFWKVYLNIWRNVNFFKLFKEIGLNTNKKSRLSITDGRLFESSEWHFFLLSRKMLYIYYYFDLRRAICSILIILLYFELSKNFIIILAYLKKIISITIFIYNSIKYQ